MDATMLSDEQLSALELMMAHADDAHILAQGAPKRKRKQKTLAEMFPDGFHYEEEYVGTGSRAANREMKARKAEKAAKPDNREIVKALETAFAEQSDDNDNIVRSVREGTETTKDVAKTLADWLKWSKDRAFREDHKAVTEESISPPTTPRSRRGNNDAADDVDDSDDFEDATDRNGRRTRRRRKTRGKPRSRLRARVRKFGRSKLGKIAGLAVLAGAGLGISSWLKDDTSENLEKSSGEAPEVSETENNVPQGTTEAQTETPRVANTVPVPSAKDPDAIPPSQQDDLGWDAASTGALLLGGAKRIPFIGAAVSAADGIYQAKKINDDDTLSDEEKKKAQVANATQTGGAAAGATAGAWAGGIIGSIIPGAGTAIGAALGGLLGGYLGDKIGGLVAEKITDETDSAIEEDRKRREQEDAQATLLDNPVASKYSAPIFMPLALGGASPTGNAAGFNYGWGGGGPARYPGQTSQRANDIAKKVLSSEKIGGVSEQFESGGRGVGTVSSGAGDYGGVSYGKHQLASANGSMSQFLASPEAKNIAADFNGLTPGTAQFNERYREVAGTRTKEMEDAQYQYLVRTHYAPTAEKLEKNLGIDMDKKGRAFKEMVYSTSMQYGGNAAAKIQRALNGKDINSMTEEEMIEAVQKDKYANVQNDFRSSSPQVQQGVAARTLKEMEVLREVAKNNKEPETKPVEQTQTADQTKPVEQTKPVDQTQPNVPLNRSEALAVKTEGKETEVIIPEGALAKQKEKIDAVVTPEKAAPVEKSFEKKSVPEKEAELAQLSEQKDFMERKVAYIKAHPEITRADDKKVDEIIREQKRREAVPDVQSVGGETPARSESLAVKEQAAPNVERVKPLEELPPPAQVEQVQTAQNTSETSGGASMPKGSARSVPSSNGGKTPSLDDIPVILDDPMLNMINIGYV